jgi:hypothetical protein
LCRQKQKKGFLAIKKMFGLIQNQQNINDKKKIFKKKHTVTKFIFQSGVGAVSNCRFSQHRTDGQE